MGLSGVQETYYKMMSGIHKLELMIFCTPQRHIVLRFYLTPHKKPMY